MCLRGAARSDRAPIAETPARESVSANFMLTILTLKPRWQVAAVGHGPLPLQELGLEVPGCSPDSAGSRE